LPAVTAWPEAVVNAGQFTCSVPEPGDPFARYTVPCTVVVLIVCANAPSVKAVETINQFMVLRMKPIRKKLIANQSSSLLRRCIAVLHFN